MIDPQNSALPSSVLAYIGLGSNLHHPDLQIQQARVAIANRLAGVIEIAFSSLYTSPPMGPQDQPHYINAVMAIRTTLQPLDLLHQLQQIENIQGRIRQAQRWVARTLDLDLLLYGEQQIHLPELTVPHIGIGDRAFVLYPLQEIAPDLTIPNLGKLTDLIKHCPLNGLVRIPA
ncbi:MAG: 2-amino-4-hydroxy-6-hydroxymethyldihydropteridine diphosphokinase [Methylococcaceae bacterium]|nr:2-amino-4-hydroxy-6-hydroxymethyldihydropteridine diphosphokinase [Methylococcaceae bacterium]